MTGRHWAQLEELAAHTFGGPVPDELRREVDWRGWLTRAPYGWTLSALGRRELRVEREVRARERAQLARRRDGPPGRRAA